MTRKWISSSSLANIWVIPAGARTTPLQDLVAGLTADGIWTKLDLLWIFAQPTEGEALVDLVASVTATTVNSPTFTANVGYAGNGSNMYIDTNVLSNALTQYVQNSASMFAWCNTSASAGGGNFHALVGAVNGVADILPRSNGDTCFWCINDGVGNDTVASTDGSGLWHASRTGAAQSDLYRNGSSFDSNAQASVAPPANDLVFLAAAAGPSLPSAAQICAGGFGAGLDATEALALYNRLRTYMTAVGVP